MYDKVKDVLFEWIKYDDWLYTSDIRGSRRVSGTRADRKCLFVTTFAHADSHLDAEKDRFCQRLHDLVRTAQNADVIDLAGDLNARVDSIEPGERHFKGRPGLDCGRSDNDERLLSLWSYHRPFLSSTSFKTESAVQQPGGLRQRTI